MTKCIDQLTFGEIKELMALFGNQTPQSGNIANPVIGKYCIARCYSAGVHAGTVVSVDGENVVLENSSRLWKWKAKDEQDEYAPLKIECLKGEIHEEKSYSSVYGSVYWIALG